MKRAESKLIEENLEYVNKIASKYMVYVSAEKKGLITLEDLKTAGYEGLIKAANRYNLDAKVKFSTYAYNWIKGEIIREMIFYVGKDALLIEEKDIANMIFDKVNVEDITENEIGLIPQDKQVKIIKNKLEEFGLDKEEIEVFLAINGVGCDKVTNYRVLARQLGKREYEIRRIKQHAEEKVRRATS